MEIVLILSGHVCRPNSANLIPFWKGFIEIQNKLPRETQIINIYGHSWNPEYRYLVELVYNCTKQAHEVQPSFHTNFQGKINPPNLYEIGIKREKSTWRSVSLQSVIGNAASRSRAVKLMDAENEEHMTLLTRWDLGQTGQKEVNQLIFDFDLPRDRVYLSYFSGVDEGYADMWILGQTNKIKIFKEFEDFCIESLTFRNDFFKSFTKNGWPKSKEQSFWARHTPHKIEKIKRSIKRKLKIFQSVIDKNISSKTKNIEYLLVKIEDILRIRLNPIFESAEISRSMYNSKERRFPTYMALNIHALLKYFFIEKKLRDSAIFLQKDDFEKIDEMGCLINPEPLQVIIHSKLSIDRKASIDATFLPFTDVTLLINQGLEYQKYVKDKDQFIRSKTDHLMSDPIPLQIAIGEDCDYLILCDEYSDFKKIKNWSYVNALIKFMKFQNVEFMPVLNIQPLDDEYMFPGVHMGTFDQFLNFQLAIVRKDAVKHYLGLVANYKSLSIANSKVVKFQTYFCEHSKFYNISPGS